MTPAEALEILGLSEWASIDEIRKAHAELIKKVLFLAYATGTESRQIAQIWAKCLSEKLWLR